MALHLMSGQAWAESKIPLPDGVPPLTEPTAVQLGAAHLAVQSFTTDMDLDVVRAFYEQALPAAGWQIAQLPWQAQQAKVTAQFEERLRAQPEGDDAEALRKRIGDFHETLHQMRRQLYATRGHEQVIVNLIPMEARTAVFLNRWQGNPPWGGAGGGAGGASPGTGRWPATNVCCSGEEVQGAGDVLAYGIRRYPGSKLIAKSTGGNKDSVTMILKTPDAFAHVEAYYIKQMAYSHWALDAQKSGQVSPAGSEGAPAGFRTLTFRNANQICLIAGSTSREASGAQTLIMISVMPKPPTFWEPHETDTVQRTSLH